MNDKASKNNQATINKVTLNGLAMAPPQVLGGVRIVPLLRDQVRDDLRLTKRTYDEDLAIVNLNDRSAYYSYVPHALVASWSDDGSPTATFGAQLSPRTHTKKDGKVRQAGWGTARVMTRMRAREDKNRLRFLPLHLAMEGFLALYFGGPDVVWEEYSRTAMRDGLSPRVEASIPGRWLIGLDDALRLFEIHPTQVGTLVFIGDALASAFVLPHPDDYRALHETLLTDFYGELLYYYGFYAVEQNYQPEPVDPDKVSSIEDLRGELARLRSDWSDLHALMTTNLFERPLLSKQVYKLGPFQMQQFITDLDPKLENHIGEAILREDGCLEYLKTYRLSAAQCRRVYLLKQLAEHDWSLEACGQALGCTKNQLVFRLEKAGFAYLLHQHILDAARAEARRR